MFLGTYKTNLFFLKLHFNVKVGIGCEGFILIINCCAGVQS